MAQDIIGQDGGGSKRTVGERSIWTQQLVDEMSKVEEEAIFTYEDAHRVIGMPARPNSDGYQYLNSAIHILQGELKIQFENIKTVGYRRMTPEEVGKSSFDLLRKKVKSTVKKSKRRTATAIPHFDELSPMARQNLAMAQTMAAFYEYSTRSRQVKKLESNVSDRTLGLEETLKMFSHKKKPEDEDKD